MSRGHTCLNSIWEGIGMPRVIVVTFVIPNNDLQFPLAMCS